MKKVITYGTYDLLHYGHIRLLERAKSLGDYLIVGVTADDFDKNRGKINVQQSLVERVEAVRQTGIADEIIVEEYEGQKIDDIIKYGIDIFTVGDDWAGTFDYLNQYCQVVYLSRTQGVSSTEIRDKKRSINFGLVGNSDFIRKVMNESNFVNGLNITSVYSNRLDLFDNEDYNKKIINDYDLFLDKCEAIYVHAHPSTHYELVKKAIELKKHVLCEAPLCLSVEQCEELFSLAEENNVVLNVAIRTAFSTAFHRLLLLVKGGKIGDVVCVDATCTSLKDYDRMNNEELDDKWNSISDWGPTALLPVFEVLGTDYSNFIIASKMHEEKENFDVFSRIMLIYKNAIASIMVGNGVKSEGELIISGTKGYIYVPAPWWKTEYFEIRFEDSSLNKRYFYQLDGEGIRNELVHFVLSIDNRFKNNYVSKETVLNISRIIESFTKKDRFIEL